MNFSTLSYVIVTIATLLFCGLLLFFVHDQGTHDAVLIMAGLAVGHWFGYSNQLTTVLSTPAVTPEPPKPS
jgi:hypothetical protein